MATGSLYNPTVPAGQHMHFLVRHVLSDRHVSSANDTQRILSPIQLASPAATKGMWQQGTACHNNRVLHALSPHSTGCWMKVVSFRSLFWVWT